MLKKIMNFRQWHKTNLKKGVAAISLLGLTAALMTGCSGSDYEAYKLAMEKTEAAKSGIYDMQIGLENTFDTSQATEAELKVMNYLKSMKLNMISTIDSEKNQMISDAYVSFGGLGFDFTFYDTGKNKYIKYPVMKKYMDLSQMQQSGEGNMVNSFSLSQETQKVLGDIWSNLATEETVVKADDVVLQTQNGDLKAKQYNVEVSGAAVKTAILDSYKAIAADPELKKMMESQKNGSGNGETPAMTLQMTNMDKVFEKMEIEKAVMKSFIDVDGYVVQEEIDIAYKSPGMQPSRTAFTLKTTNTELNKPVTLEMPTFDSSNVYTQEELNRDMPAVFKEFTK